jgi:hypothetical protein
MDLAADLINRLEALEHAAVWVLRSAGLGKDSPLDLREFTVSARLLGALRRSLNPRAFEQHPPRFGECVHVEDKCFAHRFEVENSRRARFSA